MSVTNPADTFFMDLSFGPLFSSLLISMVGAACLLYGKKAGEPRHMLLGLVISVYPYFLSNVFALWAVFAVLLIPLFALRRA